MPINANASFLCTNRMLTLIPLMRKRFSTSSVIECSGDTCYIACPDVCPGAPSVRVGKWELKIGMHIADDLTSGQNIKLVAKKRAMDAHKDMKSSRFKANPGVRQQQQQQQQKRRRKRIKRVSVSRWVDALKILQTRPDL